MLKQTFSIIGVLILVLLLFNISIRVYDDVFSDCDLETDKVTLSESYIAVSREKSHHSSKLCCPKVFIYDPRVIERKAQQLHDQPLHLNHLDPLNIPETFDHIPYGGNASIPASDRVRVLTELLRWMPDGDEINQSLIIPAGDPVSKIWYSKDFVNMFSMRIALSQCVTTDPHEADLFLVPMSVHTDHAHGRKTPLSGEWDTFFASMTNYQLIFEHFSAKTASKHVIFSSSFGHSRRSVGLWHPPFGDARVAAVQRVALGSACLISQTYRPFQYFFKSAAHVHSAPFTSLLPFPEDYFDRHHWSGGGGTPTTNLTAPPRLLATAFFGIHARDKIRKLRTKLISICNNSPNCSTKAMSSKTSRTDRKAGILNIFESKKQSIFCLEPEGDWPTRQSMIQDIALGCIPVFFSRNHLRLWPAFWGNFIDRVGVSFDHDEVMSGKVDVMRALGGMSEDEIARRREVMRAHKHQLDFLHVNDYMRDGNNHGHSCSEDAANLLLFDLHDQAQRHPFK